MLCIGMASVGRLAAFANDVSYQQLPDQVRAALKRRVLDAVGGGIGHLGTGSTPAIRRTVALQNAAGRSRLWGTTSGASPSDAAFYNAAVIATGNGPQFLTTPPVGTHTVYAAVLAAAEARSITGESLLTGLAVAHELHGELAWRVPTDGVHHTTHASTAATAGVARAVGLSTPTIESAISLATRHATLGSTVDALTPIAAGTHAHTAVNACFLAENGVDVSAPSDITRQLRRRTAHDAPPDQATELDLDPGCERVQDAAILPYDVHAAAQSAIAATIDVATETAIDPAEVASVQIETFADAVSVIDPSSIAAAFTDRTLSVHPGERAELQPLADGVDITAVPAYTAQRDDGDMPARVTVETRDGSSHAGERQRFPGHPGHPAGWGVVEEKFMALAADRYDSDRRSAITEVVRSLEAETATELARLLD